jgi:hypothetical protein
VPQAGPYGITQFDAPGIIGAYQQAQQNRISMMVAQKQLERLDKQTQEEEGVKKAIAAYYGGGNTSQASPNASGTPIAASGAPGGQNAPNAPVAAPRGPSAADREKLFANLMAIDQQAAVNVMDTFSKMDKAQLQQAAQTNLQLAQHATGYKMLPYEQRKAAIQRDAPMLQQLGLQPDQVAGFDPTDQNLNQIIAQSFDVERLAQFVQPKITPITDSGSALATDASGNTRVIYESPTIKGPNEEIYQRPSAMSGTMPTVSTPQEAAKLPPGTQFRLPDGRIGTVPGGAGGNASGGFQ